MRSLVSRLGVIAWAMLFAACGAGSSSSGAAGAGGASTSSASGKGGSGSTGSEGNGGSGSGISVGCSPACVAPQFCSVSRSCIDPGKCLADGDCANGTVCDTSASACVPGGGCAAQEIKIAAIPPNLLIALDRSCSMTDAVNGTTKWAIAVGAINKMTTSFAGRIRFGMTLFPDLTGAECSQNAIPIPVGPGKETEIQTLLTAALELADPLYPDGPCVTNIDTAMQQAATEPAFNDVERDSYAILLTDGKQSSCNLAGGDAGTTKIIKGLAAKNVPTFVIGFGSGIDAAQMNIFADAGGVPSGDPTTRYYKAENQMSLDLALSTIANKTLSCTFALEDNPAGSSDFHVFFNNDPKGVSQDPTHADGWDYDAVSNQIIFYGSACDAIKNQTVSDIDIVLECATPTPD